MKQLNYLMLTLMLTCGFVACGDDDEGGTSTFTGNENKNIARYAGLEFPHISSGNSTVITHSTSKYGTTYSLEWDHDLKAQRWTAFYFTKDNKVKNWSRNQWDGASWEGKTWSGDPFQLDPKIPYKEQPSVTGEFSGSSYPDKGFTYFQRGHICASEDRMASKEANGQTFYMSNMFPQGDKFNGKLWSKMESFVRNDWGKNVTGKDTLFVVKGGTISEGNYTRVGTGRQLVCPRYFYMAILSYAKKYAKTNGGYSAIAFWMEHKGNSDDVSAKYAITIDADSGGIAVDNIPMRGCSGQQFTLVNRDLLTQAYSALDVGIIIMQFGGNSMPYLNNRKSVEIYCQSIGRQIDYVRSCCPQAKILFIGPSDMSTREKGNLQTYPWLPTVVDSLRATVNRHGAAYWSIYHAMGGWNSMVEWNRTGLAGSDYVHFSSHGAEKMGNMLAQAFADNYQLYCLRRRLNKNNKEQQPL